ncbi:MAG: hypothetical protein AAF698_01400 [Pseudomonadota bacterium]
MTVSMTVRDNCLVVRAWGAVTVDQVFVSLDRLIDEGQVGAGMDRLIILERTARLDGFTFEALRQMRARMHAFEVEHGRRPRYRIAIVAVEPAHRGLASLYRALWSTVPDARVKVHVTDDVARAEAWLGLTDGA